jgi:hypothetical protein
MALTLTNEMSGDDVVFIMQTTSSIPLMHLLGWTESSLFFAPSIFADLLTQNIRKNKNMIITSFRIMSSLRIPFN